MEAPVAGSPDSTSPESNYTVVARRYRPKSFEQLIGQEHVAQALGKAIATGRVGHAYLFTGARGVGKTSTARIFAKALNLQDGMNAELIDEISSAIDSGDDIDVIEIDGASNRGINEIRQLRANANVRPSRARYKVYIIDEVHMLTKEAFNALLKTLEEPPPHVKFIFCTTDPEKIPITVLSRCQRFDFVPVKFEAIVQRLQEISANEGYQSEPEALALLARRAAGSMRDSQSLLEQVMSFSAGKISAEQVHALLGIADESLLLNIIESLQQKDAVAAVSAADAAMAGGADPGQLSEQLLTYLRDVMAVGIGGSSQLLKVASPLNHDKLKALAEAWGIQTVLHAIQILDESLARMRTSVSAGTLLEVALVQICHLEQLASIPALIAALESASPAAQKKKSSEPAPSEMMRVDSAHPVHTSRHTSMERVGMIEGGEKVSTQAEVQSKLPSQTALQTIAEHAPVELHSRDLEPLAKPDVKPDVKSMPSAVDSQDELGQWRLAAGAIEGILGDYCSMAVAVVPRDTNNWTVVLPPGAYQPKDYCEHPGRKAQIGQALLQSLGRTIQFQFDVKPGHAPVISAVSTSTSAERTKRMRELTTHPMISQIIKLLDGEIVKVIPPARPPQSGSNSTGTSGGSS